MISIPFFLGKENPIINAAVFWNETDKVKEMLFVFHDMMRKRVTFFYYYPVLALLASAWIKIDLL
jgi:hypothetical protein